MEDEAEESGKEGKRWDYRKNDELFSHSLLSIARLINPIGLVRLWKGREREGKEEGEKKRRKANIFHFQSSRPATLAAVILF